MNRTSKRQAVRGRVCRRQECQFRTFQLHHYRAEAVTLAKDLQASGARVHQVLVHNGVLAERVQELTRWADENRQQAALLVDLKREYGVLQAELAATLEDRAIMSRDLLAVLGQMDAMEAQMQQVMADALRFVPVEGLRLADGSWGFRLPAARYGNLLARRLGHIAAARVRAGLRTTGRAAARPNTPGGGGLLVSQAHAEQLLEAALPPWARAILGGNRKTRELRWGR